MKKNQNFLNKYYFKASNYNELIDDISNLNRENIDWWVSKLSNRNPLLSYAFKTSSDQEHGQKSFLNHSLYSFKNKLKTFTHYSFYSIKIIVQFFIGRLTRKKSDVFVKPITIIDKFILPGFVTKERYYNSLFENLDENEKSNIYCLPTFVNFPLKQIYTVFKQLRNSDRQYIIKEDFLHFSDIIYAILFPLRIKSIIFPEYINDQTYLKNILLNELYDSTHFNSAITGLINFRFIIRLKERGVQIKLFIDWWENQGIDKSYHYALSRFHPETFVIGYLGYVPRDLELQLFPTDIEVAAGVIPKKIFVIGQGFSNSLTRYTSNLNIDFAPAFRFQHLWELPTKKIHNKFNILVALTVDPDESRHILNELVKVNISNFVKEPFDILVKPHPTMTADYIFSTLVDTWPREFQLVSGMTSEYIYSANILVTGMSSIALESLAVGVPVIVFYNSKKIPLIPIPTEISQKYWKLCRDSSEFVSIFPSLISSETQTKLPEFALEVRNTYFEPVTKNSVRKFLNIF